MSGQAVSETAGEIKISAAKPAGAPRRLVIMAFLAAAAALPTVMIAGAYWRANAPPGAVDPLTAFAMLTVAASLAVLAALWWVVDQRLLRSAKALAAAARLVAHGSAGARAPEDRYGDLADVARAVNELSEKLAAARRGVDLAVAEKTAAAEEQKRRLGTILQDLHEGVLVCNAKHQILLYNQTALDLLHLTGGVGLGRSLLHLVMAEPITHTLERLTARVREERHLTHAYGTSAQFVGATVDGQVLLEGRMSVILQHDADGGPDAITGYVVTLADATGDLAALGKRDALLRAATEGFRQPVANLRASLEIMVDTPELTREQREEFQSGMTEAMELLNSRLEQVTDDYRSLAAASWPMSDIHSGNLFNLVHRRVGGGKGYAVTPVGLPQWMHVDSYSLVVMLDYLIEYVYSLTCVSAFDIQADVEDRWTYIDILWQGPTVPSAIIDTWQDHPLPDALGGLTVGDVLTHHRSTLWSEPVKDRPGYARLRMPISPAKTPPHVRPAKAAGQVRPEFFDFNLLHQPLVTSELGRTPLDQLHYVVFDTETTGLSPSGGDEIIQIAAVRIVNGRILTGESFNQLVNPKRPIPPESIKFHGVTDEMVADQPTIEQVLPKFRAYVSGAVIIAHNAAFDLKFIKMKEKAAGVRFDAPVLDTMLLSRMLQGDEGAHTLDGIAERLGVEVIDRHTALGDSLVTAAVFLRMVEMLKERDVRTLDDAIRAANIIVELAERERAF
jgi:DNA polymerase III subunit epsilon